MARIKRQGRTQSDPIHKMGLRLGAKGEGARLQRASRWWGWDKAGRLRDLNRLTEAHQPLNPFGHFDGSMSDIALAWLVGFGQDRRLDINDTNIDIYRIPKIARLRDGPPGRFLVDSKDSVELS